jgi:uncharacterized membrane protein
MKKYSPTVWIAVFIALLPAGYLALIWSSLPETVPVHFGPDMKPDRYGNKSQLWLVTGLLAAVSVGLYFLLNNLHRIDPKRKDSQASSTFGKLAVGLVVFMAALNLIIISSAQGAVEMQRFLFPLLGLMFAFIGNYMNHIKPNYFAGIRLPWTLSSDENWRRTHQLAGKLWFAGGILIAVISLLLPIKAMLPIFIGIMVVLVLLPVYYSYKLFKQQVR